MMRWMKALLACGMLFMVFEGKTQQVNGHWFGIGRIQRTGEYNAYLSEMVLLQKGKNVNGYLNYYFKDSLLKVNLKGLYNDQTHRLTIDPFQVIYYLSPNAKNSIDCFVSGNFVLTASKTESVLNGRFFSDDDHKYTVPDISIRLTHSNDTAFLVLKEEEPVVQKDTLVKAHAEPETILNSPETEALQQRNKAIVKEISAVNNRLRLELYDNGQIDYDSVSLFLNNRQILPKTMLTHKAIKLFIDLDPALETNEISMFAENLGQIPPNTAAMIIYDGTTRYEAILTSDLKKNATIRIRRKTQ